jgi:hypothetical protein
MRTHSTTCTQKKRMHSHTKNTPLIHMHAHKRAHTTVQAYTPVHAHTALRKHNSLHTKKLASAAISSRRQPS